MTKSGQAERLRALLRPRAQGTADRPARLPQPQPASPARAAATAVGRAAERLYRMPVLPVEVRPGVATLADLPELLPDHSLLIVLQGPGDRLGVMALDFETVTALIEVQALGRVTARPAERRRLTRSDAAICVDFVNAVMAELAVDMAGVDGFGPLAGYRHAIHLDDVRPLVLMLEDRPYRSLFFDLRLGGAESRQGRILIALPQGADLPDARPRPAAGQAAGQATAPSGTAAEGAPRPTLAAAVTDAPVEVLGILCRRRITLGELRALAPGRLLALPRASLAEARLETRGGQVLAVGKLGESGGCYAIRLCDPSSAPAAEAPSRPAADRRDILPVLPPADLADRDPFRALSDPSPAAEGGAARLASAV